MPGRLVVVGLLALYVGWLAFFYEYHFIDGVNLAFHEAGHLFFGILGRQIGVLGGTLGQLLMPAAVIVHFLKNESPFEAAVTGVWFAESLMYTAEYMADAQALALPLVGGHIHDWRWMLSEIGLLEHCEVLGAMLHGLAVLLAIAAVGLAAREALRPEPAPAI